MEKIYYKSLNTNVLIVAVVNEDVGDWAAYIGAVEGNNHDLEYTEVAKTGSKVDRIVGEHYFPFCRQYTWRS